MIRINNGLVFKSCDKMTDFPYDSYYASNFEFGKPISRFSVGE
jgi:hypothetical protein